MTIKRFCPKCGKTFGSERYRFCPFDATETKGVDEWAAYCEERRLRREKQKTMKRELSRLKALEHYADMVVSGVAAYSDYLDGLGIDEDVSAAELKLNGVSIREIIEFTKGELLR